MSRNFCFQGVNLCMITGTPLHSSMLAISPCLWLARFCGAKKVPGSPPQSTAAAAAHRNHRNRRSPPQPTATIATHRNHRSPPQPPQSTATTQLVATAAHHSHRNNRNNRSSLQLTISRTAPCLHRNHYPCPRPASSISSIRQCKR